MTYDSGKKSRILGKAENVDIVKYRVSKQLKDVSKHLKDLLLKSNKYIYLYFFN